DERGAGDGDGHERGEQGVAKVPVHVTSDDAGSGLVPDHGAASMVRSTTCSRPTGDSAGTGSFETSPSISARNRSRSSAPVTGASSRPTATPSRNTKMRR